MACSHAAACPLFPLLNASLDGWRRCYCDSADGWRDCARYQQSLRGQYVPLSLLPNGHDASMSQGTGGGRAGDPPAARAPGGGAPTLVDLLFEHVPALPATDDGPPAAPDPREPAPAPQPAQPASTPSWWRRLAQWMRSPA
jgi:hypothetical protein